MFLVFFFFVILFPFIFLHSLGNQTEGKRKVTLSKVSSPKFTGSTVYFTEDDIYFTNKKRKLNQTPKFIQISELMTIIIRMITIMIVPQRKVLRRKEVEEGVAFLENQETLDPTCPKMRIVETFRNLFSGQGLRRALVTCKSESSIRAWKLKSFVCMR